MLGLASGALVLVLGGARSLAFLIHTGCFLIFLICFDLCVTGIVASPFRHRMDGDIELSFLMTLMRDFMP